MNAINDTIFRIKAVIRAIEGEEGLNQFDSTTRDILVFIGQSYSAGQVLRPTDIAANQAFGSPATIYGRLNKLTDAGWIKSVPDAVDGRVRHVIPTPLAQRAFERMSNAIQRML